MDEGEQPHQQTISGPGSPVAGRDVHIGQQHVHVHGTGGSASQLPWTIPARAVGWTGRETEVREIKDLLEANHRVALVGPGGIGKTAVAAQVIFELTGGPQSPGMFPGGIFSHDYYRQPGHHDALTGLLGQAGADLRSITDDTGEVRRLFSRAGVLLYLEGCEKAEDIMALLELTGQVRVLLTSRYKDKVGDALAYDIHPLPDDMGAALIHFHARRAILPAESKEREPWLKLAGRLGGHPLALRLAGAWMAGRMETPEEFSRSLQTGKFGDWAQRDQRRQNLQLLFAHSAEAVAQKHPHALETWFALALHGHAPIHLAALCGTLAKQKKSWLRKLLFFLPSPAWVPMDAIKLRAALDALVTYSLAERSKMPGAMVEQTEPSWQLTHALLGEWGRDELGRNGGKEAHPVSPDPKSKTPDSIKASSRRLRPERREEILLAWFEWWAKDLDTCFTSRSVPGGPARFSALQPHWQALLTLSKHMHGSDSRHLTSLQSQVANAQQFTDNPTLVESLTRQYLGVSELILGPEHPDTLASLNNLALLLKDKGDLAGSEPLNRRALAARERVLGPEHPDTLSSLNALALLLRVKGDLAGAESLYQRALATQTRVLGLEHRDTLTSQSNLAFLLYAEGDFVRAEPLAERAALGFLAVLGPDDASTRMAQGLLAVIREALAKGGKG